MTIEEKLQNPRSGCSLVLVAFGLLAGLGIAALGAFALTTIPDNWREMKEIWIEAPGVIMRVGVKEMQVRTGNQPKNYHYSTNHIIVLECKYTVQDKEYVGTELVAPEQAANKSDENEAQRPAATLYHPGDAIAVYHHPTDLQRARLEAAAPNGLFWLSVIFGPLILLAGVGLTWWVWTDWRGKMKRVAT